MKVNHLQISKFIIAGSLAALTEFIAFVIFRSMWDELVVAHTLSFMCGFVISFLLQKNWVFRSTGRTRNELPKYLVLAVINIVLSNLVIAYLVDGLGIQEFISKILIMSMVACWNYLLFQRLIFRIPTSSRTSE